LIVDLKDHISKITVRVDRIVGDNLVFDEIVKKVQVISSTVSNSGMLPAMTGTAMNTIAKVSIANFLNIFVLLLLLPH
jgi:hypothetical protein